MKRSPPSALLLLNGDIPDAAMIRRLARRCRVIICADGGARHARRMGLVPDVVVGDMDSLPRPLPRNWTRTLYWCDFNENSSDFDKALEFMGRTGCGRLYVAGLFGGRLDHCMVNLSLARRYGARESLVVVDRGMAALLGPGRYRLGLRRGQRLSLLAVAPRTRLSVTGARYPLRHAALVAGSRGLSNVAQGPVGLHVHAGLVWAMAPDVFEF